MSDEPSPPRKVNLDQVGDYYSAKIRQFGPSPQGVDWGTAQRQERRFAELAACFAGDNNFSILDLGCGYGAFHDFLIKAGKQVDYLGRDISTDMIAEARKLHPGAHFEVGELDGKSFDYVIASGIFNVMRAASPQIWESYVLQTITEMFAQSGKACAFNFLTSHSDQAKKKPDLYYADPTHILDFCIRTLSRNVALSHHYGIWDFTVVVRRESDS